MEALTLESWRRQLLALEQAVREARAQVNAGLDPNDAERAYSALRDAQRAVDEHYAIRPMPP